MQRKIRLSFIITGMLFLLSTVFTIVVMSVDVQPIGPEQSQVGLATINAYIFNLFGTNMLWYKITDWFGFVAIFVAIGFGLIGLVQMIKGRGMKNIDTSLLVLGLFYVIVLCVYILFELFIINYRPVILETSLEASFPSSHTILVVFIMSTAILQFQALIKNKTIRIITSIISAVIIAITVIGRLISGVHWLTDIIGSLLIGFTLIMAYYTTTLYIEFRNQTHTS